MVEHAMKMNIVSALMGMKVLIIVFILLKEGISSMQACFLIF